MPRYTYSNKKKHLKVKQSQLQQPIQKTRGHWNHQENMSYIGFLQFYQNKLQQRECRRLWKVFKAMSSFIKTRSPNQCRSHHQKMLENQGSLQHIINNFKSQNESYFKYYKNIYKSLSKVEQMNNMSILAQDFIQSQQSPKQLEQADTNKFDHAINTDKNQTNSQCSGKNTLNSQRSNLENFDQLNEKQFMISKNSNFKQIIYEETVDSGSYLSQELKSISIEPNQLELLQSYTINLLKTTIWFYEQTLAQQNFQL